jgi:hypothetical protein
MLGKGSRVKGVKNVGVRVKGGKWGREGIRVGRWGRVKAAEKGKGSGWEKGSRIIGEVKAEEREKG